MRPITGPLRQHPTNPRYFADGSGKAIYLTGAHTWSNLKDLGATDPPPAFDFDAYLDFLVEHNHNLVRLWTWELCKWAYDEAVQHTSPFPWPRVGLGPALDGKPRFDLLQFDPAYFRRLRQRVAAAAERGIYVSIMCFEGHGIHASLAPWCWDGHPFNVYNNINGIDGDPQGTGRGLAIQTLAIPAVTHVQEAYVRQIVDTVNDLDNVLYEIVNESGAYSTSWQYHMIDYIHAYERTKPKQHPVGMTFQFHRQLELRGANARLFNSPADWISPNPEGGYQSDPPVADGRKVILTDTDHLWGIGGNNAWVWKSFCRGHNPLFMDPYREREDPSKPPYPESSFTEHLNDRTDLDPRWEPIRRNLGYTLAFAERMDLDHALPWTTLASTGYCLAAAGQQYLVYLPEGGQASVDLSAAAGRLQVEWLDPESGQSCRGADARGRAVRRFTAPFAGHAVLFIHK